MFIIKSHFADSFEINSSYSKTLDFFSKSENYVDLMPNLDSIRTDGKGITRWTISAEVPFIGNMQQSFAVDFFASDSLIEWLPSPTETQNYLRCVAEIIEKAENKILVRYSQFAEMRRKNARELHPLANLTSESKISQGVQKETDRMLKIFTQKAKEKLEKV
jgi:hypothetical protein